MDAASPAAGGHRDVNPIAEGLSWLADPAHWTGGGSIPARLVEHLGLSVAALVIACAIALPAGLYVGHTRRGGNIAVGLASFGRAIPSLALIGILVPLTQAFDPALGFTFYPSLLAMAILAIPPILVNTFAGVNEVDRDVVEAAKGMGFTGRGVLRSIEIPLALPVIIGGLRSATVQVIATATLAAIYGFGGLGRLIVDGVAQLDDGMLFGGVILVALLAIAGEGLLALLQRAVARRSRMPAPGREEAGPVGREPTAAPAA